MKQPVDILASDLLGDVARRERQALVAVSALGLIAAKSGLVPSRISALGIEFGPADQHILVYAVAAVVVYFLLGFLIYAGLDLSARRLAFFRAIDEVTRESQQAQDEGVRKKKRFWIRTIRLVDVVRVAFEFAVPVVLAICCLIVLSAYSPVSKVQPAMERPSKTEAEFVSKERCAAAADRIDKHFKDGVSEVFFSQKRNSCVCEVASLSRDTSLVELFDCLTRESLATASIKIGPPGFAQQLDTWKRRKDALR